MSLSSDEQTLAVKLFTVLVRTHNTLLAAGRRDFRQYGLNQTEFAVLELLYHRASYPLQQIGEKILITSGSITYVINKLERKGLLARTTCAGDRRVTYASLTETGHRLIAELFPRHGQTLARACRGLTTAELEQAIILLSKIETHPT